MGKRLIYAGIGSRETPQDVLGVMFDIGSQLARSGWTLRSGFADGADNAFAAGADRDGGTMEIYLPWSGFNGAPTDDDRFIVPEMTDELLNLAAMHHPAWNRCSSAARKLHARNGCQVLGLNLALPADLVICWTKGGLGGGGTGQALRIAKSYKIPIFDLAIPGKNQELCAYVEQLERVAA